MSNIKFVSHEKFSDDQYTKELVYLLIDDKYRVCYVRKEAKTGGLFWSVPSVGVTKGLEKEYFESFMQDSAFLEKDIRDFLKKRPWEKSENIQPFPPGETSEEEVPF